MIGNKTIPQRQSSVVEASFNTVLFSPQSSKSVAHSPTSHNASPTMADELGRRDSIRAYQSVYQQLTPPTPYHTFPGHIEPSYFNNHTPQNPQDPTYSRHRDSINSGLNTRFEGTHCVPISPRPSFSGQSPRLIDLLQPGSELNARPGSVVVPPVVMLTPPPTSPTISHSSYRPSDMDEDDVEEIIRQPSPVIRVPPATQYNMYTQPHLQQGSPEMLMMRFDKQTCGILSVKDGPTENPWRTLVWPRARDSPALYHAIASMTAFHGSVQTPSLRFDGMEHMRSSIRSLAAGIGEMRTETALATTLALAFSESWDQHISTGIEHLRGAKILVKQALSMNERKAIKGEDLLRLRFLCSTFVYMDVIARLTSVVDDDDNDDFLESLQATTLFNADTDIDPLMGCAATLFPLIGRAANLCRKVRKHKSNSLQLIAEAHNIKEKVEHWLPPPSNTFRLPEDPTSDIQHALHTAEAYRYATLLYLHQAVPELPSLPSSQLARKVLTCLASVPLSSRLVIVQIYPLLAAGCEIVDEEDRKWIEDRWLNMARRMWIGNIDRCWEVMQEVWSRRDLKVANTPLKQDKGTHKRKVEIEHAPMGMVNYGSLTKRLKDNSGHTALPPILQRSGSSVQELDPEMTVRGPLHWVGVMKDWSWESKFLINISFLSRSTFSPQKRRCPSMVSSQVQAEKTNASIQNSSSRLILY